MCVQVRQLSKQTWFAQETLPPETRHTRLGVLVLQDQRRRGADTIVSLSHREPGWSPQKIDVALVRATASSSAGGTLKPPEYASSADLVNSYTQIIEKSSTNDNHKLRSHSRNCNMNAHTFSCNSNGHATRASTRASACSASLLRTEFHTRARQSAPLERYRYWQKGETLYPVDRVDVSSEANVQCHSRHLNALGVRAGTSDPGLRKRPLHTKKSVGQIQVWSHVR